MRVATRCVRERHEFNVHRPPGLVANLRLAEVPNKIDADRDGRITGGASGTAAKLLLAAYALFTVTVAAAAGADRELPGIVVTGKAPVNRVPPDIVMRDREQRSPDIHWPKTLGLFIKYLEMFGHNAIEINAPVATVWDHLVQAQQWPQWYPDVAPVKIKDGSPILEKNTKFMWKGIDLPLDSKVFGEYSAYVQVDSQVSEYVPESRIAWTSYGLPTPFGPYFSTYHTWLLTPIGAKRCRVIFEEVATGRVARWARGACPEIMHNQHDRWLEQLKKISER